MMKRLLALSLGILLMFSFAFTEGADAGTENLMVPRQFMSMYNEMIKISADMMRASWGDAEADRLTEDFSLTLYDLNAESGQAYYGSKDWVTEATFVFEDGKEPSYDDAAFRWYVLLGDEAGENAARLVMYSLNMMIGYRYKDTLGTDAVQHYFSTFQLGEKLPLPDGYEFVILRPQGENGEAADYVVFAFQPPQGN